MPGIAETIRQGLFFDEFEKQRERQDVEKTRASQSALLERRADSQDEQANIRNAREDRRDVFSQTNRADDVARQALLDKLSGEDRASNRAFQASRLAQGDRAAEFAAEGRSDSAANQAELLRLRGEDQRLANEDRVSARKNQSQNNILGFFEERLKNAKGDPEAEAQIKSEVMEYLRDPEGFFASQGQGAPPEGPGAFSRGVDSLRGLGQKLIGGQ